MVKTPRWLILKSGLIQDVRRILENPSDYIDSERYFSWEQFFTALLVERTQNSHLAYTKSKLNPNYLNEHEKLAIIRLLPVKKEQETR